MANSEGEELSAEQELLEMAQRLRTAVARLDHGELLSLYAALEKLGLAEGSDALEQTRHRLAVRIYRDELMARLNRS